MLGGPQSQSGQGDDEKTPKPAGNNVKLKWGPRVLYHALMDPMNIK